jgi:tetrahydromethanopterin S-methyltransferase subunit A
MSTFDHLLEAVQLLEVEEKQKLVEILEQQIFEAEEEAYEDDAATLLELEQVQGEYDAGNYVTFDQYLSSRSGT